MAYTFSELLTFKYPGAFDNMQIIIQDDGAGDTVKIHLQKTNSTSLNASNAYINIKKVCNQ